MYFTLVDKAFFALVNKLDWIFNSNNMIRFVVVDVINHGRQRCRLSGTGRTGHENDAARMHRNILEYGWRAEVIKAQEILETQYGVGADVWSVTSYSELYRDGHSCERWNLLHPGKPARVPYVARCFEEAPGVFVAASDYVKALPDSIDKWLPRPVTALGTDGFGRSETRASLREFFEVDSRYVILATLAALARDGKVAASVVKQALKAHSINPEKPNPAIS